MLVHIVIWKVIGATDAEKAAQLMEIRDLLESLPGQVPYVKNLRVGINVVKSPHAADVVLYTEFNDLEALQAYQQHPAHLEIAEKVGALVGERRAVDFWYPAETA